MKPNINLTHILRILFIFTAVLVYSCSPGQQNNQNSNQTKIMKMEKYNELNDKEKYVILNKGTEAPFTGKFNDFDEEGVYTCRQCNTPLYKSGDKFEANCGWPSFDDEIEGAVKQVPDADGRRTEIVCANCDGHLGHVFVGEQKTAKNTRHCVNSVSLDFKPITFEAPATKTAYYAGGCFWGMEYYFQNSPGVIDASSGYMGGHVDNPTYKQICTGTTGHLEVIKVIYDPSKTNFRKLTKLFFEIHNPEQTNGQGPDIGSQYLSAAYFENEAEKETIKELISELESTGFKIATSVSPLAKFWKAEEYHQDYYQNNGQRPYCHGYTKRFKSEDS